MSVSKKKTVAGHWWMSAFTSTGQRASKGSVLELSAQIEHEGKRKRYWTKKIIKRCSFKTVTRTKKHKVGIKSEAKAIYQMEPDILMVRMNISNCVREVTKVAASNEWTEVLHLLLVLPTWWVQRLDESGGVANEHGVAGRTHDHAEHGEPHIGHPLRSLGAIADAQHVAHGFEEGVGVLHAPRVVLSSPEL